MQRLAAPLMLRFMLPHPVCWPAAAQAVHFAASLCCICLEVLKKLPSPAADALPPTCSPLLQLRKQYTSTLVLCCVCLAILVGCLVMVLSGMARVKRSGQVL